MESDEWQTPPTGHHELQEEYASYSHSHHHEEIEDSEGVNAETTLSEHVDQVMQKEEVLIVDAGGVAILTTPDDSLLLQSLHSSPTRLYSFSEPFRIVWLPWLPLTIADREVLEATAISISLAGGCSIEARLAALHFTHTVLLKDFPPEVLLQRPAFVMALMQCIPPVEGVGHTVQLLAVQCLLELTEALHARLLSACSAGQQRESQGFGTHRSNPGSSSTRRDCCCCCCQQEVDAPIGHPFPVSPDPVDSPPSCHHPHPHSSLHPMTVQQYVILLLGSPLPSFCLFGSVPHPDLRTASALLLRAVLRIVCVSVRVEDLWMTCGQRSAGAQQEASEEDGHPAPDGRTNSGDEEPACGGGAGGDADHPACGGCCLAALQRGGCCNADANVAHELVRAIARSLEQMSLCLISSHEERWLLGAGCDAAVYQHSAVVAQARGTIMEWLHHITRPVHLATQVVSDSLAEAVVLILCDITSILHLLPSPSPPSAAPPEDDLTGLSQEKSSVGVTSLINGSDDSPEPPEELVTLFSLLSQVDPLANDQVLSILSVCSCLQSSVRLLQCSSRSLPLFLTLSRASLPALPLHSSQVLVQKVVDGVCRQHSSASGVLQRSLTVLLLELLCCPHRAVRLHAVTALHSILTSCTGVAAATAPPRLQQQRAPRCSPLLHRAVLAALLHCCSGEHGRGWDNGDEERQELRTLAQATLRLLLLMTPETVGSAALHERMRAAAVQALPELYLLADNPGVGEALRVMVRGEDVEEPWMERLELVGSLQGVYHRCGAVRSTSLRRLLSFLDEETRSTDLLGPGGNERSDGGTCLGEDDCRPGKDVFVMPTTQLCQDYHHIQLQPHQVIRLVQLLDSCGSTADLGHPAMTNTTSCPDGGGGPSRSFSMAGAVWRQLAYVSQHPGHHSVLLSLTPYHYYTRALQEMMQVSVGARGFSLSDTGPCIEVMRHVALHSAQQRGLMAADRGLLTLLARCVLVCWRDLSSRRQAAMLLFMLIAEPHVQYPDTRLSPQQKHQRHAEDVGDDAGEEEHSGGDRCRRNGYLNENHPMPKITKLMEEKLYVPFYCSTTDYISDVREQIELCRTCVENIIPDEMLLQEGNVTADGVVGELSQKEDAVERKQLDESYAYTFQVEDLLRQKGGCSEQIHSLLKMVWMAVAAGGATDASLDIDYSSNFSNFLKMNEREKLLFECTIRELFIKKLLRSIENSTNLKDVEVSVCTLESILASAIDTLGVTVFTEHSASSTHARVSTSIKEHQRIDDAFYSLLKSGVWWPSLGRVLQREPTSTAERQLYGHVVRIATLVCEGVITAGCGGDGLLPVQVQSLLVQAHSPLCISLTNSGSRRWGQHNGGRTSARGAGGEGFREDQVSFRVLSSLCELGQALTTQPQNIQPRRSSPEQHLQESYAGTTLAAVLVGALDPVLEKCCQKNPFSLGVLCSAVVCLASLAHRGWLTEAPTVVLTVRHCARLISVLSVGRGGSSFAFLGRYITLHAALTLGRILAHLPVLSPQVLQHLSSPFFFSSSSQYSLPWVPVLLSYRDSAVRSAAWLALAAVTAAAGAVGCRGTGDVSGSTSAVEGDPAQWLLRSAEGGVELWPAVLGCVTAAERSGVERSAAMYLLTHVLAHLNFVPATQGASVHPPLVTDTLSGESVSGVEGVLVLLEHHHFYDSVRKTLTAVLQWRVEGQRDELPLLPALLLMLGNLTALRPDTVTQRLVQEGILDLVARHLEQLCLSDTGGDASTGTSPLASTHNAAVLSLKRCAALLTSVLARQPGAVPALARDSVLPRALVAALAGTAWPGAALATSCYELLGWMVDSRPLLSLQEEEERCDVGQLWGCVRVQEALEESHQAFLTNLVRALHIDVLPSDSGENTMEKHHLDSISYSHPFSNPGFNSTESSGASLSKAAASFLSLYIHGLIEQCDRVGATAAGELSPLHQFSAMLAVPTVLLANKSVYPGFEFAKHIIQLISHSFPHSVPKSNPDSVKQTQQPPPNNKLGLHGKRRDNSSVKHQRRHAASEEWCRMDPVYLECLEMLAFISQSARYACYHLGNLLLPVLLRPLQELPQLLQDAGVHFTSNLVNKKDVGEAVLQVCRTLRVLTNIVSEQQASGGGEETEGGSAERTGSSILHHLSSLCSAVLPLLHPLWLPALHTPLLLHHLLAFLVTSTRHMEVCPMLLRTSPLPASVLTSQRSSRSLLTAVAHCATQNIAADNTRTARHIPSSNSSRRGRRHRFSLEPRRQLCPGCPSTALPPQPPQLCSPGVLRGADTTLLGGGAGVREDATNLMLCILSNTARVAECASVQVKSGIVTALLEAVSSGAGVAADAGVKVLLVLSLHTPGQAALLRHHDWLRCLHRAAALQSPASHAHSIEPCPHVLRLLTSLASAPAAVQAMVAHDTFLGDVLRCISRHTSPSCQCLPAHTVHALITLLWAVAAAGGHRAQSALRQAAALPLLRALATSPMTRSEREQHEAAEEEPWSWSEGLHTLLAMLEGEQE